LTYSFGRERLRNGLLEISGENTQTGGQIQIEPVPVVGAALQLPVKIVHTSDL